MRLIGDYHFCPTSTICVKGKNIPAIIDEIFIMNAHTKKKIISKLAPLITATGVQRLFGRSHGGIGHILMFHRVVPESNLIRIHNHLSLEITPDHFESTLNFFLRKNYEFISLDQLTNIYRSGNFPTKNFVVVTFDDGYKDNLEIAYPILKKYNIPFAVYVTTGIPNKKAVLWWYLLEDLVRERDTIQFAWQGENHFYISRNLNEKEHAFERIQAFVHKTFTIDNYKELFTALFVELHTDITKYSKILGMRWDDIQELNSDPLVTIGAHTVNHFPLSQLNTQTMEEEIYHSKVELENQLNQSVNHFSYPYGKSSQASEREYKYIEKLSFKTATTTNIGNLRTMHHSKLYCLPRININRVTDENVLKLQTSGMLPFIVNKGKKM